MNETAFSQVLIDEREKEQQCIEWSVEIVVYFNFSNKTTVLAM